MKTSDHCILVRSILKHVKMQENFVLSSIFAYGVESTFMNNFGYLLLTFRSMQRIYLTTYRTVFHLYHLYSDLYSTTTETSQLVFTSN